MVLMTRRFGMVVPRTLLMVAGVLTAVGWTGQPMTNGARSKVLIAHRGASAYAPEHTRAAYQLAIDQGADYVEQDLQITQDGVLVCLHDLTLERTTNVEEVFADRFTMARGQKTWPVADF